MRHFELSACEPVDATPTRIATRLVTWPYAGPLETAIFNGHDLHPGMRLDGPAVVEYSDTTCAVHAGWQLEVDTYGARWLTRERTAA